MWRFKSTSYPIFCFTKRNYLSNLFVFAFATAPSINFAIMEDVLADCSAVDIMKTAWGDWITEIVHFYWLSLVYTTNKLWDLPSLRNAFWTMEQFIGVSIDDFQKKKKWPKKKSGQKYLKTKHKTMSRKSCVWMRGQIWETFCRMQFISH